MATPFTILTGFLGAGKTTVLNRTLGAPRGRRIAVLVNELGRVAIDSRLILGGGGDVLELAGGCVCCKIDVKNDLWDGIADVVARSRPDHVVLETTGIAEPAAILAGLDRAVADPYGVVCVVDADAAVDALDRRPEVAEQIQAADRLLLSKLDIAGPDRIAATHAALDRLNRDAERAAFPAGDAGTAALVPWLLARRAARAAARPHRDHLHQVAAATFVDAAPLLAGPLLAAIDGWRDRLLRVKGVANLAGESRRAYVELAGRRVEIRPGEPWGAEPRCTELVLIGEGIDDREVRRRLWACRAPAAS